MADEQTNLLEWVRGVLAEEFSIDPSAVTPQARLAEDLGLESLDLVDLLLEFERFAGRRIGNDDVAQVQTVADVVALLERLRDPA